MTIVDDFEGLLVGDNQTLNQINFQADEDDSNEDPALITLFEETREMPNRSHLSSSGNNNYSDISLSDTMPSPTSEDLGDSENDSTVPNDQYGIGEEPKVSEAECPVEVNQSDDQLNPSEQITTRVMMITSSSDLTPSTSDTITGSLEIESSFVKTTDLHNDWQIVVKNEFYRFHCNLKLMSLLVVDQQLRYASDIKKGEGYRRVGIENDDMMRIQIPDILIDLHSNFTPFLLIARLTTHPYQQQPYIFIHPYPLWMKNRRAKNYRGCLFIEISREMIEKTEICFDTLMMIHEKQSSLKKIKQLRIHRDDFIDQSMPLPDGFKAKKLINDLDLNKSALFFQIFLLDEKDKTLFPTDICCQTEVIRHRSAHQMKKFRQENRTKKRTNLKRLQKLGQNKKKNSSG